MSLSTNWRASTGRFISSRDGDDATGTGTKASPYKTIALMSNTGDNNLRAGYYAGATLKDGNIIGDGKVYWDASGESVSRPITASFTMQGVEAQNHLNLRTNNNLNGGGTNNYNDCIFKNVTTSGRVNNVDNCLVLDGSRIRTRERDASTNFFRCTFISSLVERTTDTGTRTANYTLCFFSKGMTVAGNVDANFNNCAFEANGTQTQVYGTGIKDITLSGDLDTIGNTYASNERFSGTATVGGENLTFTNSFYTEDPLFNNEAIGDYTLTPASPLVNNLAIIGKYSVAIPLNAQSAPFTDAGASYTNVTPTGTKFILDVGQTEGTVTSTDSLTNCITLPFPTTVSEAVQAFGTFLYNQGEWIDKENYNPATNPEVRLTWEFSALDENTLTWGPFVNYEVGLPLETDNAGLGNGNVNADMADLGAITAKRFRVRFTIRTNGV